MKGDGYDAGDGSADRVRRGSDQTVRRQADAISQIEVAAEIHRRGHARLREINRIFFDDPDEAYRLFHELVPDAGEGVQFTPPFNVDYGIGLTIGRGTFLNKDFMVCGGGYVTLGEDCLIGPRCTIATPTMPKDAATRLAGWEHASAVTIGDNVWFGANVTVTPGVTIGSNSIIGAGSVVTRDIPENVIAVGNPAHVIREIPEHDPAFADVEGLL